MSEYESVQKGSLKLKGVMDGGVQKKKKKKKKHKEKGEKITEKVSDKDGVPGVSFTVDRRTKAELAFERVQEQRKAEEILKKAGKTHKERITDFNHHLDNLTEHFDIPKVSWTK